MIQLSFQEFKINYYLTVYEIGRYTLVRYVFFFPLFHIAVRVRNINFPDNYNNNQENYRNSRIERNICLVL